MVHIDWVTALPPGGEEIYNACLVIVAIYSKNPIFIPFHKDDTALLICNRAIYHTGFFENIINDRDTKFKSALWKNLHKLLGTKIPLRTTSEFFAYGLELQDSDGFTHDWYTLIPELELAYKTSIHASTGKTPAMLEKGWNPKLQVDTLKKYLVDIHPNSSRSKFLLDEVSHHENKSITDYFEYSKQKWDKSHKTPEFKVGELILVSALNFNNIIGPKKLKGSFSGPFIFKALHGKDAVQVELSGELENEHPNFPVSLVKH
ncbi:hypothetical protein O181_108523 [Austropuccinia psidii MF-1]|uniref:Integrase catalytic domain-containing protein n=1 Tax=Austropuccinia psidii MF-1 TaxID=1389203 RepID=A0A9Q3JSZ6_9BASI|nr:hypothetical protein [Austropuccinia psidii MF-1]